MSLGALMYLFQLAVVVLIVGGLVWFFAYALWVDWQEKKRAAKRPRRYGDRP